jgi:small nuclear ribonucleoprotein
MTKRPMDILDQVLNRQPVIVSLKGGRELRGILQGYDIHMNLVLDRVEEDVDGQVVKVGTLIVRGDNVIYISPTLGEEEICDDERHTIHGKAYQDHSCSMQKMRKHFVSCTA